VAVLLVTVPLLPSLLFWTVLPTSWLAIRVSDELYSVCELSNEIVTEHTGAPVPLWLIR
jgi:hypothetical protein